jgi:hypothetical protein
MDNHISLPRARTAHLVTTRMDGETLVYDATRHHIHHLNPLAATVWGLCEGRRTVAVLARDSGLDDAVVHLALRQLAEAGLLDGALSPAVSGFHRSRRAFMRNATIAGVAVPMIISVSAPHAAAQSSALCGSEVCGSNETCLVYPSSPQFNTCCPNDCGPNCDCGHTDCDYG